MRDFLHAVKLTDVVEGINGWRESSVKTEELVVDGPGQGQVVEERGEILPGVGVPVLAAALVVEAIDLCDLAGFVVATEDRETLGVAELEGEQEGDGLDTVKASVNIISHEEIVGFLKD